MKALLKICTILALVLVNVNCVVDQATAIEEKGHVDWSIRTVKAIGFGVPRANVPPAQGKILARRAAIVSAQRELLGIIKGVTIDAETTIKKGVTEKSEILSTIEGVIRGAAIIREHYEEGVYEVEMAVSLSDIDSAVLPIVLPIVEVKEVIKEVEKYIEIEKVIMKEKPDYTIDDLYETITEEEIAADIDYSSIVVDCRDFPVKSAMYPRMLSETGEELYGHGKFDEAFCLRVGPVGYVNNLNQATHLKRAGRRPKPLFIKAIGVEGSYECDPVISVEDAEKVKAIDNLNHIFDKARVIFVVN